MTITLGSYGLVYAKPKYVYIGLTTHCQCGLKSISQYKLFTYARIHVTCKDCKEIGFYRANRADITDYFIHLRGGSLFGDVDFFLDRWENDMIGGSP